MKKTMIAYALLSLVAGAAHATPANPLMRPLATVKPADKPGVGGANRLQVPPAPPPVGSFPSNPPSEDHAGADNPNRKPTPGSTAAMRQALAKYVVVSISGDMAVLRPLPTYTGVAVMTTQQYGQVPGMPGAPGMPMMPTMGQDPMTAQNQIQANQANQVPRIYPSILLQSKKKTFVQDAEVIPHIQDGVVVIRLATTDQVVFSGRIEGISMRPALPTMDTVDQGYVTRNSPPVANTSSNGSSSSNAAPAAGGGGVAGAYGASGGIR